MERAGGQGAEANASFRNDVEESAYLAEIGTDRAGKAVYHVRGETLVFVHTEVGARFSGQGIGTQLVRFALDDVRSRGLACVPICPFFAAFIEEHPDYLDLVDHELQEQIYRRRR